MESFILHAQDMSSWHSPRLVGPCLVDQIKSQPQWEFSPLWLQQSPKSSRWG